MRTAAYRISLILSIVLCFQRSGSSQTLLQPGFDGAEYRQLLQIGFLRNVMKLSDSTERIGEYNLHYRSPEVGLKNRWDMWYREDGHVAAINIRGTIGDPVSWLENFYAAMVPATGFLQLSDSNRFDYQLSADPKAMVHAGWLLGLGFLAPTMLEQIHQAYRTGIHEFIVFGHSQGGALAYLTRSYLYYQQRKGMLPADIVFKTYCSAAPKPGNLYYAYDFDFITRNGWGFNVINAADWVPESPFSVQTLADFNPVNPFVGFDKSLKKQPWLARQYIKGKFNKMNRRTRKAQRAFREILGDMVYKQVKKALPEYKKPEYSESSNYQRAGIPIVLQPDEAYYEKFPIDKKKVFLHHSFDAYFMLTTSCYAASSP